MSDIGGVSVDAAVNEGAPARSAAMTDVARLAGVSHQTVSRVLHGHPHVRAATRTRVLAAIAELDYHPNLAARALATGSSRTLGLVTIGTSLFGPIATLYGIESAAREAGYFVSVVILRSIERKSIREAVVRLAEQGVDGVIVIAPLSAANNDFSDLPTTKPVVVVEGDADTGLPAVTVNQFDGAFQATKHLLDAGHATVLHIGGPSEWYEARDRLAGWRAALRSVGAVELPVLFGDWGARSGFEAGTSLARTKDVTAVFASNDHMALGLLRSLAERGLRVPRDISVVGFDDIAEAEFFAPPLTTVRQDFAEVGRQSLALVLKQLHSDSRSPTRIVIPAELVVRASSGPPPTA